MPNIPHTRYSVNPTLIAEFGRFLASAGPWIAAGFNVIPATAGGKRPAWKFAGLYRPDAPRVSPEEYRVAMDEHRDANPLVLPSSADCFVVDVDDLDQLDICLDLVGPTDVRVYTSRGVHLWYRGKQTSCNGVIPGVDLKGWGGYVVGFGAVHASGAEYQASFPPDTIPDIPEAKRGGVARLRALGGKKAGRKGKGGAPRGMETVGLVPASETVKTENGNETTIEALIQPEGERGPRVFAFDREDSTPSCDVFTTNHGTYFTDWARGRRWKVVGAERGNSNLKLELEDQLQLYNYNHCSRDPRFEGVSILRCSPETFVSTVKATKGVSLVSAPVGAGKTLALQQLIPDFETVHVEVPPRALTIALAARLGLSMDPRAPKTIQTTKKGEQVPGQHALVAIDEYAQALSFGFSRVIRNHAKNLRRLHRIVANADRGLMMSADLKPWVAVAAIQILREENPDVQINLILLETPPMRREIVPTDNDTLDGEFFAHVRRREGVLVYLCDERLQVEAVECRLHRLHPDLRVLALHAKRDRSVLADPDACVRGYDVIVANHSVGTGVSFNQQVEQVYVNRRYRLVFGETICQTIARFRSVANPRVLVGQPAWNPGGRIEDPDRIKELAIKTKSLARRLCTIDPTCFDFWALLKSINAKAYNEEPLTLQQVVIDYGWGLSHGFESDHQLSMRSDRERARDLHVEKVMAVRQINKAEAEVLRHKVELTEQQHLEMERFECFEFYGTVNELLIRGGERKRRAITRLAHCELEIKDPNLMAALECTLQK